MLVLSRKNMESVIVGDSQGEPFVTITVLGITGGRVKLGFEVAADVPVHRLEVWERLKQSVLGDDPTEEPAVQVE